MYPHLSSLIAGGGSSAMDKGVGAEAIFRDARSFEYALDLLVDETASLGFDAVDYAFMPAARNGEGGWNAPNIEIGRASCRERVSLVV